MDATENLEQLGGGAKLAAEITAAAVERFCADFEYVEERLELVDRLNGEGGEWEQGDDAGEEAEVAPLRALFPRTVAEIRVLLG